MLKEIFWKLVYAYAAIMGCQLAYMTYMSMQYHYVKNNIGGLTAVSDYDYGICETNFYYLPTTFVLCNLSDRRAK